MRTCGYASPASAYTYQLSFENSSFEVVLVVLRNRLGSDVHCSVSEHISAVSHSAGTGCISKQLRLNQAGSSPLCLSSLFQHKLLDFVALRPTGFVFLLLFMKMIFAGYVF